MEKSNLFQIADDVLKQIDIVEIVSHYTKLQKRGRNYTCLCPFHDDKKLGNFYVSQEKQFFKCFSCGTSGNAINFVQKRENITYIEALRKVCEIAGINEPRLLNKQKSGVSLSLQETYKCLNDITDYYKAGLTSIEEGKVAINYLHSRGLNDEVISYFNIGYAYSNGTRLIEYLQEKKYSIKTIANTGIVHLNDNPLKDINVNRIIFPIANKNGQIVAFSARVFKGTSDAKYVNTRETEAFKKSNTLYNFHNVLNETKKVGYIYVLEGFMDVIACYRVNIKSAVGIMGTALTKEHIQLLRYLNVEIRLCLDLDAPGQDAMVEIIKQFDKEGLNYKLVNNLTSYIGKDSDEILSKNGDNALITFLNNLISKGEWLLNYYSKKLNLNSLSDRKKLVNQFLPVLNETSNPLELEDYMVRLSNLSNFTLETLKTILKNYKKTNLTDQKNNIVDWTIATKAANKKLTRLENAEKTLMKYILENKEALNLYNSNLGFMTNSLYLKIIDLIEDYIRENISSSYSSKDFINYLNILDNWGSGENKELINNEIIALTNDDAHLVPYSEKSALNIIKTINEEREKKRRDQSYIDAIKGKSDIEKAQILEGRKNLQRQSLKNKYKKKEG